MRALQEWNLEVQTWLPWLIRNLAKRRHNAHLTRRDDKQAGQNRDPPKEY
ncbi:hypothetical protein SynWH8103_01752 [Synechococcus sp. WH 8103]|nr:hypothetical protein SynWH8103_01752 [Synechococcus sp. WH 8103]